MLGISAEAVCFKSLSHQKPNNCMTQHTKLLFFFFVIFKFKSYLCLVFLHHCSHFTKFCSSACKLRKNLFWVFFPHAEQLWDVSQFSQYFFFSVFPHLLLLLQVETETAEKVRPISPKSLSLAAVFRPQTETGSIIWPARHARAIVCENLHQIGFFWPNNVCQEWHFTSTCDQ